MTLKLAEMSVLKSWPSVPYAANLLYYPLQVYRVIVDIIKEIGVYNILLSIISRMFLLSF